MQQHAIVNILSKSCLLPEKLKNHPGYSLYAPRKLKFKPFQAIIIKLGYKIFHQEGALGSVSTNPRLLHQNLQVVSSFLEPREKETSIVMKNNGPKEVTVKTGSKIAILIFVKTLEPILVPFGST